MSAVLYASTEPEGTKILSVFGVRSIKPFEPVDAYKPGGVTGSIFILVKFEQLLKHAFDIYVTELGIVIDSKDVHPWNTKPFMVVIDSGKTTLTKELQYRQNACGTLVILSGITHSFNEVQFWNKLDGSEVSPVK